MSAGEDQPNDADDANEFSGLPLVPDDIEELAARAAEIISEQQALRAACDLGRYAVMRIRLAERLRRIGHCTGEWLIQNAIAQAKAGGTLGFGGYYYRYQNWAQRYGSIERDGEP